MSESAERFEEWIREWLQEQRNKLGLEPGHTDEQPGQTNESGAGGGAGPWQQFVGNFWPGFDSARLAGASPFGVPLGWGPEHAQAWHDLASAQAKYQKSETDLFALIHRVQLDALSLLEQKISARRESEPLKNVRELYDLWIECGEQVYAQCAQGEAYCGAQAEFANAAIELRAKQQAVLERGLRLFDLPTRAELNSVHRQLRELRERMEAGTPVRAKYSSASKKAPRKPTRAAKQRKTKVRRSSRRP